MLLCALGVRLLGNVLAGKGAIVMRSGQGINRAGYGNKNRKGIIRASLRLKTTSISLNFKYQVIL